MQNPRTRIMPKCILLFCLLVGFTAGAQEEKKNVNIATFGNSLTMTIRLGDLIKLAETRDHAMKWKRVGIAGTSLDFLWNNREKQIAALLAEGGWDYMPLHPSAS